MQKGSAVLRISGGMVLGSGAAGCWAGTEDDDLACRTTSTSWSS